MTILPYGNHDEQMICAKIENFFAMFHVGNLLRKCNTGKEKGIPVMKIFRYLITNVFNSGSMYMQSRTKSFRENFSKNTCYRFLNSAKTNRLRFTTLLSAAVVNDFMRQLTAEVVRMSSSLTILFMPGSDTKRLTWLPGSSIIQKLNFVKISECLLLDILAATRFFQ